MHIVLNLRHIYHIVDNSRLQVIHSTKVPKHTVVSINMLADFIPEGHERNWSFSSRNPTQFDFEAIALKRTVS